jgi:hypothetical protein
MLLLSLGLCIILLLVAVLRERYHKNRFLKLLSIIEYQHRVMRKALDVAMALEKEKQSIYN